MQFFISPNCVLFTDSVGAPVLLLKLFCIIIISSVNFEEITFYLTVDQVINEPDDWVLFCVANRLNLLSVILAMILLNDYNISDKDTF